MSTRIHHPLLIDTVIGKILKYVDMKTIKNCRLVSLKWNEMCLSLMKRNYKLSMNPERLEMITNSFTNYMFQTLCIDSEFFSEENFENSLLFSGQHLKRVEFRILNVQEINRLENFQTFLELCPNVQEVDLVIKQPEPVENPDFFFYLAPSLSKIRSLSVDCDEVCDWLSDLIEACGNIKILRLQLEESAFANLFERLAEVPAAVESICQLEMFESCLLSVSSMECFLNVPWRLNSLRIFVANNCPASLMRSCLSAMSETLVELKLCWLCWNENKWGSSKASIIPLDLKRLESLEINTADKFSPHFFYSESLSLVPSFINAIQLPRIKSVRLNGKSTLGAWTQHTQQLEDFRTYQSMSLQKLTIIGYRDYTCFLSNTFPHLTELSIVVQTPCPELIASVFSTNFSRIEKLTLVFDGCTDFQWEIILLGSKETEIVSRRVSKSNSPLIGENSIRNLKDLRTLNLQGSRLSDNFIYKGLVHLSNLRSVTIPNATFSKIAVNVLIQKLGPHVNLNFKNKGEDLMKHVYGLP